MAHKFFIFIFLFLSVLFFNFNVSYGTTSYLINEKTLYKELGNLSFFQERGAYFDYVQRQFLYTDNFTNSVFDLFYETVLSSSYSLNDYPYILISIDYDYVSISASKEISINNSLLYEKDFIYLTININPNNGNISSVNDLKYYSGSFERDISFHTSKQEKCFLLSSFPSPKIESFSNDYLPMYSAYQRNNITYSSNDIIKINKFNPKNNIVLNKEYDLGLNLDIALNYYYIDENNNKISVNDKISSFTTNYWWGVNSQPFINKDVISTLNEGLYYCDYIWTSKNNINNNYKKTETHEVFEIYYDNSGGNTPSGDIPSGDTPSGDTPNYNDKLDNISGLIGDTNSKLDGISGEIAQTNNKLDGISGELGEINDNLTIVPDLSVSTINSGDIESALNFDFAEDPYSNFWLELTTGLSSSLTSNNRSISIDFRNETYYINLDDFALQVPEFLKSFLSIISTTLVVWQIVRYIKVIVDKISSGDMDTVLAINEEERNR